MHEGIDAFQHIINLLTKMGAGIEADSPRGAVMLSAMVHQAVFKIELGDIQVEDTLLMCLPHLRELNLEYELGLCLYGLGICREYQDDQAAAIRYQEQAFLYLKQSQHTFAPIACLAWLGWAYYGLGEYAQAGEYFQEGYQLCQLKGNYIGLPYMLSKMGTWADALKEYSQGLRYHQEAQIIFEELGDQAGQGYTLSRMSLSAWGMGDYEQAINYGKAGYEHFNAI